MVIQKLTKKLQESIKEYGINSVEVYNMCFLLSIEIDNKYQKNTLQNYCFTSIDALVKYIQINEINPSEVRWNRYAVNNGYLSSQTLGYIYGQGFNKLCKEIRKYIKKSEPKTPPIL